MPAVPQVVRLEMPVCADRLHRSEVVGKLPARVAPQRRTLNVQHQVPALQVGRLSSGGREERV